MKSDIGPSFGELVDSGMSKEEIMKIFCMNDAEYQKVFNSLQEIRNQKR